MNISQLSYFIVLIFFAMSKKKQKHCPISFYQLAVSPKMKRSMCDLIWSSSLYAISRIRHEDHDVCTRIDVVQSNITSWKCCCRCCHNYLDYPEMRNAVIRTQSRAKNANNLCSIDIVRHWAAQTVRNRDVNYSSKHDPGEAMMLGHQSNQRHRKMSFACVRHDASGNCGPFQFQELLALTIRSPYSILPTKLDEMRMLWHYWTSLMIHFPDCQHHHFDLLDDTKWHHHRQSMLCECQQCTCPKIQIPHAVRPSPCPKVQFQRYALAIHRL